MCDSEKQLKICSWQLHLFKPVGSAQKMDPRISHNVPHVQLLAASLPKLLPPSGCLSDPSILWDQISFLPEQQPSLSRCYAKPLTTLVYSQELSMVLWPEKPFRGISCTHTHIRHGKWRAYSAIQLNSSLNSCLQPLRESSSRSITISCHF